VIKAEDSLKSFSAQSKAEIQGAQEKINLLAAKLSTGKEYRNVICDVVYNWDNGTRTYVRTDTGEIAGDDIIPESDLQEHMAIEREGGPVETEMQDVTPKQLPEPGAGASQG
jgi:hypothetical protein